MAFQTKPFTSQDFDEWVNLPENVKRSFEFIGGKIVEVVSNTYSSKIAMLIGARITLFVVENNLGHVTGADGGYQVFGERYIPDVAYISRKRQAELPRTAYNPLAPDLAVEVLSPTNDPADIRIKLANYLRAGTTFWLVDPDIKQIQVFAPNEDAQTLKEGDLLEGGSVLPGFRLEVKSIFA
jgi:Uma2 family endonuclease